MKEEAAEKVEGEAMPEDDVEVKDQESESDGDKPEEKPEEKKAKPETMPTAAHIAQKSKWKQRLDTTERNAAKDKAELELLRMQVATPKKPPAPPNELDFDSTDDYRVAHDAYLKNSVQTIAQEVVQQHEFKAERDRAFDSGLEAHYKYANDLKADDFSETENVARSILGDEVSKEVITRYQGTSAAMLYSLGKNESEARRLSEMFSSDPTQLVIELTRLSDRLTAAPNTQTAPPPDEPLEGGQASTASLDRQIEKARKQQQAGKLSMNELIQMKRSARAAGWVQS
jgi:hypothetical protein|tara:strand:- start:2064 stop:2921 length:858 start_codon:yes stop_codon:yes gene_type:complete